MFGQVDASGVGGVRLIVSGVCMKSPCAAAVLPAPLLQPLIDPSIQNSHHSAVFHRTALEISGFRNYNDFTPRLDLFCPQYEARWALAREAHPGAY
jgi:hypothetical protein